MFIASAIECSSQQAKPLRIGIAGLTHDHVRGLLGRPKDSTIVIVGIAEPNRELREKYIKKYNLSPDLLYSSLDEMLDKCKPEAVCAFNSIYEHLSVVQACAPRKIDVMVEKPLAVSVDHAKQMQTLVKKHGIQLLTNYETTWYGSNHKAYEILDSIGDIRKVVVHDGHQGPKEINVSNEFFGWLTDPEKNGGGAIIDFGCYGANLITWLMKGEKPISVSAITQQIKPNIYPKVDDEATIIVTYPKAQGIIQASWNWPFGRKDMEVYGVDGYVITSDNTSMTIKNRRIKGEPKIKVDASDVHVYTDPFAYFADVIRGNIVVPDFGLYSLENNVRVVQILDAARESAITGKTVYLKKR